MANVYVEARPKGRPEGSSIDDYVVEDHLSTCLLRTKHSETRLNGPRNRAIILLLLGSDI